MLKVDLNSDLGESFGHYQLGDTAKLIPLITSCNVACGFHAGDYNVMNQTVQEALASSTGIGAHPGFPDLNGFGRRFMDMDSESVSNMVTYQIAALAGFVPNHKLHHVKPHGALYNTASKNYDFALAVCKGIQKFDPYMVVYALANSQLVKAAQDTGLRVAQEIYADRNYEADGTLVSRKKPNAVLHDPVEIAERAVQMIKNGSVTSIDGKAVPLTVDSICVHGDNEAALNIVKQLLVTLQQAGIEVQTF